MMTPTPTPLKSPGRSFSVLYFVIAILYSSFK